MKFISFDKDQHAQIHLLADNNYVHGFSDIYGTTIPDVSDPRKLIVEEAFGDHNLVHVDDINCEDRGYFQYDFSAALKFDRINGKNVILNRTGEHFVEGVDYRILNTTDDYNEIKSLLQLRYQMSDVEAVHAIASVDSGNKYLGESVLAVKNSNRSIHYPSYEDNPDGCDYVRVVIGQMEVAYWSVETEFKEDPVFVLGALLGAAGKRLL